MMKTVNFDTQLLRSFVTIIETGSFVAAAGKLNMTQPAISQQMRRLEELTGHALFQREGRKLEITTTGEHLARIATKIIALNDEISDELGDPSKEIVHIGMPEHYSETLLPKLIGRVHERLPNVQLVIKVARSRILSEALAEGRLQMALTLGESDPRNEIASQFIPIQWLGSQSFDLKSATEVVRLVLFKPPCAFRQIATESLERAGLRWKCEHECEDLMTIRAALRANIGVAALPFLQGYSDLVPFDNHSVLPSLPDIPVRLRRNERWRSRHADGLAELILELWNPPPHEAIIPPVRRRRSASPRS